MEIKVLVADDELPARGELKYQLASMVPVFRISRRWISYSLI